MQSLQSYDDMNVDLFNTFIDKNYNIVQILLPWWLGLAFSMIPW